MFAGYQQQDAQEFIRALLDKMHEELNEKKGKTLIMQMFQGLFVNEVKEMDLFNSKTVLRNFLSLYFRLRAKTV